MTSTFLTIFFISIILNYIHGIECIKTKFWEKEPHAYFYTKFFKTIPQAIYFEKHGNLWFFILIIFFILLGNPWIYIPLVLYGTIFITEFHHFVKGMKQGKYYPGMITAALVPIVGIFYLIDVIKM